MGFWVFVVGVAGFPVGFATGVALSPRRIALRVLGPGSQGAVGSGEPETVNPNPKPLALRPKPYKEPAPNAPSIWGSCA